MHREVYERLIRLTIAELPEEVRNHLDNLEIVIKDRPSRTDLAAAGLGPRDTLLGLYTGVPLTQRTTGYGAVLPDKITIFRRPIEARARSWEELVRLVRETVLHEIGHHIGMSEADMERVEEEWRQRPAPFVLPPPSRLQRSPRKTS